MTTAFLWLSIAGGSTLTLVFWVVFVYNRWVGLALKADKAWADVDVFLKKRHDLIPSLVALLETYMGHEKNSLEDVTRLRQKISDTQTTPSEPRFGMENELASRMRGLIVQVEAYHHLKADAQFRQLAEKLAQIEDEIEASRRYYNALANDYNTSVQSFPNLLLSGIFRTRTRALFRADGERETPVIKP